jgi:hypothetical protein
VCRGSGETVVCCYGGRGEEKEGFGEEKEVRLLFPVVCWVGRIQEFEGGRFHDEKELVEKFHDEIGTTGWMEGWLEMYGIKVGSVCLVMFHGSWVTAF